MFPTSFVFKFYKLFAPPEIGSVGSPDKGKTDSQVLDDIGDDDDVETNEDAEDESPEETEDAEDEDAETEGTEDEDILDEDADPDLDKNLGAYGPVDKKALLAKYPKLFKDFPELGKTFQREQEFTELFPTLEDAQQASAMAQEYNGVARKIMAEGDAGFILRQIKNVNPSSFEKFTDNFLEGVRQVDRDQYNTICEPIIQNVIRWVYTQGHNHGNENLVNSARFFSKVIYGNPNVEELETKKKPSSKSNEPDPERTKIDQDRANFARERHEAATNEVGEQINTYLASELEKNIDPGGKMSSYMRGKLIEDIIKGVYSQLSNEPAHGRTMKALWDRAGAANYPSELRVRIKNTFLARAKQILPSVRARVKQEAFQTKSDKPKTGVPNKDKSKNIPVGRALSSQGSNGGGGKKMPAPKEIDYRHTSDRDILDGKYTPKAK